MKLIITRNLFYLIVFSLALQSCANFKLNYAKSERDWADRAPDPSEQIEHTLYLFGDCGNAEIDKDFPLFDIAKKDMDKASEESSIIFLGDNIYPYGMPSKDNKSDRERAEHKLNVQIDMVKDFKGKIMFIPGNHDWMVHGLKGVNRQQKYIEKQLNLKRNGTDDDDDDDWEDYFFPSDGCGDPEVVEINDKLVYILIDSQWYIQNWNTDQSINEGCDIKSREIWSDNLEALVRKNRRKNVVIAMHHPLYSNGPHGGYFGVKEHLFPLRSLNKKLWLPLPGLGSIISFFRGTIGVPQDIANAKYRRLRKDVLPGAAKSGENIFVSGHEHTLQYLTDKNQHFIVSGSGSKQNSCRAGGHGKFGYGRVGYAKIDFYRDGSAWSSFYALTDDDNDVELVYKTKIKGALETDIDEVPDEFPEFEKNLTTLNRTPNNNIPKKIGGLRKFLLGDHYSKLYRTKFDFEVLDLSQHLGGLTPVKRGGGMQTNSLRLVGKDDHEYVLRSLTKDATRILPYPLNTMQGAQNILLDNFMAAHPFAALAIPPLAEAANVYHTNPKLYYVPKQPALDFHNDIFGNDIYLFEERPDDNWEDLDSFGNSKKIISTSDVLKKLQKSKKHRIDQKWTLRSRLFDMVIQDWDRHEDQWRWARFKEEKGYYYRPIPRDRDQAFSKYDGGVMKVIHLVDPFMRSMKVASGDIKNIKYESFNAKYFDNNFLNELEWPDWEEQALYIKDNLTNEIIEEAFREMPEGARDEEWDLLIEYTKLRRDKLVDFARKHYEYVSKRVDIIGTEDEDYFVVKRLNDDQTEVIVYDSNNDGDKNRIMFQRVFDNNLTKEIHLYGLEDTDIFDIEGDVNTSIKLRIIGGDGNDTFNENSNVKLGGKKTIIYDSSERKNEVNLGKEGKDKRSNKVLYNTYNRKSNYYDPNYFISLPVLKYANDDKLQIGVDISYIRYKFKKEPYGEKHRLIADYTTAFKAFRFRYEGEYIDAVGGYDLLTNAMLQGDRFAFNYFGYGNETLLTEKDDFDFNRVMQEVFLSEILLRKTFAQSTGSFAFGGIFERSNIDNTAGRFIISEDAGLDQTAYDEKDYVGAVLRFSYSGLDETTDPHRGFMLNAAYNLEARTDDFTQPLRKFSINMTNFIPLDKNERLVIASKLMYEAINGRYDFFKAPTIGGVGSLRGFRNFRFRGDKAFSHTIDIRWQIRSTINRVLPFTFGIHSGFDYGRVWENFKDSDKWHTSYGGGFWISPINVIVLSAGAYFTDEDYRFMFRVGHQF